MSLYAFDSQNMWLWAFGQEAQINCVWILYQKPVKGSEELTQQETFLSIMY